MSLTATNSSAGSSRQARSTLRPMRPKPLMPMRILATVALLVSGVAPRMGRGRTEIFIFHFDLGGSRLSGPSHLSRLTAREALARVRAGGGVGVGYGPEHPAVGNDGARWCRGTARRASGERARHGPRVGLGRARGPRHPALVL